jgi:KDO2-lipid IV(A) lauroyltransferase
VPGDKARPTLKDRLVGAAYALGWSAVCRMPESWAVSAFGFVGDIAWRRQGPRVRVLEGNLRRVLGPGATGQDLRAASRASMQSYARYWLEIFRLPVMSTDRLVEGTVASGEVDTLLSHLAAGRGVVVPLPHMGNWDQAGAWIIAQGAGSFTTVMERLDPESVYERFVAFREAIGMEVLPATGGLSPFGVLAQRLRAGKMVALPSDRDVAGGGIEVEFFGETALMMGGSAALAVQTGAALMPATLWYEGDRWGIHVYEEIPVPESGDRWQKAAAMTQEVARVFEDGIRKHPADWHMLQRVFVGDLDPDRLAAARAKVAARERAAKKNGAAASADGAAASAEGGAASAEGGPRVEGAPAGEGGP